MKWNGSGATIGMSELLVRATLPGFGEAEPFEDLNDLARLENGERAQGLPDKDRVSANEVGLEVRFPILKKQLDHLSEVAVQLVEALGLGVRTRPARNMADIQAGLGIPLDDGGEAAHMLARW